MELLNSKAMSFILRFLELDHAVTTRDKTQFITLRGWTATQSEKTEVSGYFSRAINANSR